MMTILLLWMVPAVLTAPAEETQGLVHSALTTCIEFLEAKNKFLTQQLTLPKHHSD